MVPHVAVLCCFLVEREIYTLRLHLHISSGLTNFRTDHPVSLVHGYPSFPCLALVWLLVRSRHWDGLAGSARIVQSHAGRLRDVGASRIQRQLDEGHGGTSSVQLVQRPASKRTTERSKTLS